MPKHLARSADALARETNVTRNEALLRLAELGVAQKKLIDAVEGRALKREQSWRRAHPAVADPSDVDAAKWEAAVMRLEHEELGLAEE